MRAQWFPIWEGGLLAGNETTEMLGALVAILSPKASAVRSKKGWTVAGDADQRVVILYEHALLGEGIARYLRAQLGVEPRVVSTGDLEAVTSAMGLGPAVVIFELSEALQHADLTALAPQAVLIDVSGVVTLGEALSPCAVGFERILQECAAALEQPPPSRPEADGKR